MLPMHVFFKLLVHVTSMSRVSEFISFLSYVEILFAQLPGQQWHMSVTQSSGRHNTEAIRSDQLGTKPTTQQVTPQHSQLVTEQKTQLISRWNLTFLTTLQPYEVLLSEYTCELIYHVSLC